MANIYITGMTAQQASKNANIRNLAFAGVLEKTLIAAGHDVTWEDPSLDVTLDFFDKYDTVLVGIGPITSLAANRVYGALNIVGLLWNSSKLKLFIDAPGLAQTVSSLKSVANNPTSLMKEFYSYRKGYKEVTSNVALSARISSAVDNLATGQWPQTIYPSLPWKSDDKVKEKISLNIPLFSGVSLDAHLIQEDLEFTEKMDKWVIDSDAHKDTKKLLNTLGNPVMPMKWNKGSTDEQVFDQIRRSSGAIISVNKGDGSWWTYRYIQALNARTPVYTAWAETSSIGESWSHLAHTIEDLSAREKLELSDAQMVDYLKHTPNKQESIKVLENLLGI